MTIHITIKCDGKNCTNTTEASPGIGQGLAVYLARQVGWKVDVRRGTHYCYCPGCWTKFRLRGGYQ